MKRIYLFFVALALLVCLSMFGQTKYATTTLNLRKGPGVNYGVVTVLPKGISVTIEDDCDCKWVPVRYGNYIGYIRASYLSKNKVSYGKRSVLPSHTSHRNRYFINSKGNKVQSLTRYNRRPIGATALCRDGSYSFSQSRRGTCSHHGGVSRWY